MAMFTCSQAQVVGIHVNKLTHIRVSMACLYVHKLKLCTHIRVVGIHIHIRVSMAYLHVYKLTHIRVVIILVYKLIHIRVSINSRYCMINCVAYMKMNVLIPMVPTMTLSPLT